MTTMKFPKRYLVVILTFISTSVCYIERVGFSIAYTVAADAAGVNQSSKGTILSTFYYGYACSQVPGGWAAQKIGGRKVLLLSFVLWSSTCALIPLDPNRVFVMVIARLLVGVAQGFIFPSIHTVLAQWVPPHERSRSVSLTTSGMYLGAAAGMLFLPSLVKYKGPQSVFLAEAALGAMWSLLWFKYASDPPRSEHPKATAAGFGESMLPIKGSQKLKLENGGSSVRTAKIPWKKILLSLPVWAIVVNNFTFHYALYVLMNWLPTYFELGLQLSLQEMGSSKMLPYLNMFIFSNIGGVVADHLVTKRILSVTRTRKLLNTIGFIVASLALMAIPIFRTSGGAVLCSSVALGFLALGRAGFAVNHMDIAPRYAGIVMGVSNTAGTLAGIIGVDLTGKLLEAARTVDSSLSSAESWRVVFFIPGLLCIFSSLLVSLEFRPSCNFWYPYVTGTSVVALKYKDGILMAADMGGSYGSTLRYKSVERMKPIGKHSLLGASGEISDFQELLRYLDELILYDNMWDDGNSLGPKEVHNYLTRVMYNRRNKFNPLWNSLVLGGVKKGQKYLGMVSMIGVNFEDNHVATGFGNHLARPILRDEWHENLTFEEGVKLLEKCMRVLLYRDRSAVNKLQISKITEEGVTISQPYSLKTFWGFSAFENPTLGAEGSW
ncbi:unnamed protein product [Prunus brigantina]